MRTFLRLVELSLPVGSVFFTHTIVLLYEYLSFWLTMSSTSDTCDPVFLGVVFTVFGLGAVGSFAWGTWGTTMWTLRDGIASLFIYCAYIYAQWPEVWMCVGAMTAVAYQLVIGVFLGLGTVCFFFFSPPLLFP